MIREQLRQNKKLTSMLLLAASAVCAVVILVKVAGSFAAASKAEALLEEAIAQSEPDARETQNRLADSKAISEKLKKDNLFAPPPPKQHPVSFVSGIMGNEVLINDTWYRIGQTVGDAKIVAIEPTQVKIEWDGNEKVFAPIDAPIPVAPAGSRPGTEVARAGQTSGAGAEMVQASGAAQMPGGPAMGRFGNLSEQERAAMRERFMAMRGQFESMSEAERDRFRSEMRDRFGGGPPGGGQGRGPGGGGDFGRRGR